MIDLPIKKSPPKRVNPRNLIIYSLPKIGKTSLAAGLPNSLILDFEQGSDFYSSVSVDICGIKPLSKESKEEKEKRLADKRYYLTEVLNAIRNNPDVNYEYGIIDTATALEEFILPVALDDFKKLPISNKFKGTDIRELPMGGGYFYIREAYIRVMKAIEACFKNVILLGHVKDKFITTKKGELQSMGLDLSGKLASIISAKSDAIGYMYRKDNANIISFVSKESVICGARPEHLKNAEIKISEVKDNKLITYWNKIFKNN